MHLMAASLPERTQLLTLSNLPHACCSWGGTRPVQLADGSQRTFLLDGDTGGWGCQRVQYMDQPPNLLADPTPCTLWLQ